MELSDQTQAKSIDEAAAGILGDVDSIVGDAPNGPPRGDDGKFKPSGDLPDGTASEQKDAKADDAEVKAQDGPDPADEDEEYLEIEEPGEEGAEPVKHRHKVAEVWEGFRKADRLEKELAEAKSSRPLPQEVEGAAEQMVAEIARYQKALNEWASFNQPRQPPRALIDPNSEHYNPEEFARLSREHEIANARMAQARQEMERVEKEHSEYQQALARSKMTRERARVLETWPELKEKAVVARMVGDLEQFYGLDRETVASVIDHRFYALAKDALAHRAAQTARQEAVRIVRAKPKLVRAAAKSTTDNSQQARVDSGFAKLAKSGSAHDAADMLAALL